MRRLAASMLAAGLAGCFTGDGLQGQPCRTDADCNAIADALGQRISCNEGVCGAVCGDGLLLAGIEECEDGNDVDTDECVNCMNAFCGDNATWQGVEECDDGNDIDTDACVDCRAAFCGDGIVWTGQEECDDGDDDFTDDCANCRRVACGDGELNPETEACDDGDDDENDGCNAACEKGAEALSVVGAYSTHYCALRHGRLRCWGNNDVGQLGYGHTSYLGDEASDFPPPDVPLGEDIRVRQVMAGPGRTCVLLDVPTDNLRCWGGSYALGIPSLTEDIGDEPGELPPPIVRLGGPVVALTAGISHTCGLLASGDVRCWGASEFGQLGLGGLETIGDDEEPRSADPVKLGGRAVQIAAGGYHTCALLAGGDVVCWGQNWSGELGYAHTNIIGDDPGEFPENSGPVRLGGRALQVAAGELFTCALLVGGEVVCWGDNFAGQLGRGDAKRIGDDEHPESAGRVKLGFGEQAAQIFAGYAHLCVLLKGGRVRCWGANSTGELGVGSTETIGDDEHPRDVSPVELGGAALQLGVMGATTCARMHGGAVRCWGAIGFDSYVGDEPGEMPPDPLNLYEGP